MSASKSILKVLEDIESLQSLYPALEENLGFCGLYDFTDVLGAGCAYSSKMACSSPQYTFLTLVTTVLTTVFKSCGTSLAILMVVEIVICVMVMVAHNSTKNLKTPGQLPLIQPNTQPAPMYLSSPYSSAHPVGMTAMKTNV